MQRKKTAEQLKHFCASPVGATRPAAAAHHDMLRAALDRFLQAAEKQRADDAAELHSFRIACKKARYMAEMAPPRVAQPIIADLTTSSTLQLRATYAPSTTPNQVSWQVIEMPKGRVVVTNMTSAVT